MRSRHYIALYCIAVILTATTWVRAERKILGYITHVPKETPEARKARHSKIAERRAGLPIIVHRGVSKAAPENTLEAYAAAIDFGADGVEIDIRRSKDGVLYLFHDNDLDRLTNGSGKVRDLTYYELLKITPKHTHGLATKETRPPTLIAFLELARRRAMLLHLDVKEPGLQQELMRLFDAFDIWDHIVEVNNYNSDRIGKHKKLKTIPYNGWVPEPTKEGHVGHIKEWIEKTRKQRRKGICKDPRPVCKLLGRKTVEHKPIPEDLRAGWTPKGIVSTRPAQGR